MKYNLLPADVYNVINQSIITEVDKMNLISFYEPIIGPIAISLYLTLLKDLSDENEIGIIHNHHHLMTILKSDLKTIINARESLESLGLIRSYLKVNENINEYLYEIYSPLKPHEFFNHPILGVLLLNNIGQDEFNNLIKKYKKRTIKKDGYEEITKTINDTFEVVSSYKFNDEIKKEVSLDVNVKDSLDIDSIISLVPTGLITEKSFTKQIKYLINKLLFIYDLDISKIAELICMSIDDVGVINKEKLITNAKKAYEYNNHGTLPTIIYRTQPDYLKKPKGDNSSLGRMINIFENTRPYDFLKSKNKGALPSKRELDILFTLADNYDLTPGVINVLIDYSLRVNNGKLVKNYIDSIASTWKRKGIKTVEDAMNDLKRGHKKNIKEKASVKKEIKAPSWINIDLKSEKISEEELRELEEEMKGYR